MRALWLQVTPEPARIKKENTLNTEHTLERIAAGEKRLSLDEIAKIMGVKRNTVIRRHIYKDGDPKLKAHKFGKNATWHVFESDFKEYFDAINK